MKHLLLSLSVAVSLVSCGQHSEHGHGNHAEHQNESHQEPTVIVDSDSTDTFPTVAFIKTHEDTIPHPVAEVFPLFEPEGRHLLYENWKPTVLRDAESENLEGQVIFSKYDQMDVMLTVREHHPEEGHIQYLVVWEDFEIQRIDIYCTPINDGKSTHVKWLEHNAGLYAKGTKPVTMFCTEGYLEMAVQRYYDNVKKTLLER